MFKNATLAEVLAAPAVLDDEGWVKHPSFIRIAGVPDKKYSAPNTGEGGLAGHSVVGEEPAEQDGIPNRFLSTERQPNGQYTKNAAASCQHILRKRAAHVQMYPVDVATWTTGGPEANLTTWPMEAEGGRVGNEAEPLTEHQEQGVIIIATGWEQRKRRRLTEAELREHGQIVKDLVYPSTTWTACASGRYKRVFERILAGERYIAAAAAPAPSGEELRRIIREEMSQAFAIDNEGDVRLHHFRRLLELATNGGAGAFADAQGVALPLIRDRNVLQRLVSLEEFEEETEKDLANIVRQLESGAGLPARVKVSGELEILR
jgi:hypothetical protein